MDQAYDTSNPNNLQQSGYIILILQIRNVQICASPCHVTEIKTDATTSVCTSRVQIYQAHLRILDAAFPKVSPPQPMFLVNNNKTAHWVALIKFLRLSRHHCPLCWCSYLSPGQTMNSLRENTPPNSACSPLPRAAAGTPDTHSMSAS